MVQLASFPSDAGPPLVVEVTENDYGLERVAREDGGIIQATEKLEDALGRAMPSLRTIIRSVRSLAPDTAEIEQQGRQDPGRRQMLIADRHDFPEEFHGFIAVLGHPRP